MLSIRSFGFLGCVFVDSARGIYDDSFMSIDFNVFCLILDMFGLYLPLLRHLRFLSFFSFGSPSSSFSSSFVSSPSTVSPTTLFIDNSIFYFLPSAVRHLNAVQNLLGLLSVVVRLALCGESSRRGSGPCNVSVRPFSCSTLGVGICGFRALLRR